MKKMTSFEVSFLGRGFGLVVRHGNTSNNTCQHDKQKPGISNLRYCILLLES